VVAGAALAGAIDVARGTTTLSAVGDLINQVIVGSVAVAGRLLIEANRQLAMAREQIARLAVDEERLRFARDLHDLLGHSLSVITLKSELAGRLLESAALDQAAAEIADIEAVSRGALREVRDAVAGYRQPTLSAELAGAREALIAAGIECRIERDEAVLPPAVESLLAWTVREGATNVIRHSAAHLCSIRLASKNGTMTLDVVDDGRGGKAEPGSGLRGLQERVAQHGGKLVAEPLPHEGFRLRLTVPLEDDSGPAAA
jgi:two-component system sensor histidine kinase DesK